MEELQTVYVKGLPSIVTEEDIRDIFSSCGNILQLNWDADKSVIVLLENTVVEEVVKLNNLVIEDSVISVSFDPDTDLNDMDDCLADLDAALSDFEALPASLKGPSYVPRASRANLMIPPNFSASPPSKPTSPPPLQTPEQPSHPPQPVQSAQPTLSPPPLPSSPTPQPFSSPSSSPSLPLHQQPLPPLPPRDSPGVKSMSPASSPVQYRRTGAYASQTPPVVRGTHPVPLHMLHTTIFVTNVDENVKVPVLLNFFSFCGQIKQYAFNRSKSSALIFFASQEGVSLSKQLDKAQLGRKNLNIESISLYETDPQMPYVAELLPWLVTPSLDDFETAPVVLYNPNTVMTASFTAPPLPASSSPTQPPAVTLTESSPTGSKASEPMEKTKPKKQVTLKKEKALNMDDFEEIKL